MNTHRMELDLLLTTFTSGFINGDRIQTGKLCGLSVSEWVLVASGYAGLIQTSLGNQYTEASTLVLAAANLVAPSTCTVGTCFAADFAS